MFERKIHAILEDIQKNIITSCIRLDPFPDLPLEPLPDFPLSDLCDPWEPRDTGRLPAGRKLARDLLRDIMEAARVLLLNVDTIWKNK